MDRQRALVYAGAGATAATAAAALAAGLLRARSLEPGSLRTVDFVDLERYAGRWFEIARRSDRFERDCAKNASADYALRGDGTVAIENRCTRRDGTIDVVRGVAKVSDPASNAKLRVKFSRFAPAGDYWIIDLDEEYGWAVVGEPKRAFGWVLSRTPGLPEGTYDGICSRLVTQGYDPAAFVRTLQDGA
jgi:apolipoprotein D and lipocalin family protein